VNEATTGKRGQDRRRPYEARKPQARGHAEGNKPVRHNFVVELKDSIVVPNIADRLRAPVKLIKCWNLTRTHGVCSTMPSVITSKTAWHWAIS